MLSVLMGVKKETPKPHVLKFRENIFYKSCYDTGI